MSGTLDHHAVGIELKTEHRTTYGTPAYVRVFFRGTPSLDSISVGGTTVADPISGQRIDTPSSVVFLECHNHEMFYVTSIEFYTSQGQLIKVTRPSPKHGIIKKNHNLYNITEIEG